MQRFEYKTEKIPVKELTKNPAVVDELLNELGKDGWELVSTESTIGTSMLSGIPSSTHFFFFFKRELGL